MALTYLITFAAWMSRLRAIAVEEYGYDREAALAIPQSEMEPLYRYGCTPNEGVASLRYF